MAVRQALDGPTLRELRTRLGSHKVELLSTDAELNGKAVLARDALLPENQRVVLGDGAMQLSRLKPLLDEEGVALVAVGCSREDAETFVKSKQFKGTIFLDEAKVVHRVFSCKVESWLGFVKPWVWKAFMQASAKGLKRKPTQGDFYQLGGTFVLDTRQPDTPFLFRHLQSSWGDHPSSQDLLGVLVGRERASSEILSLSPVKADHVSAADPCAGDPNCTSFSGSQW
ncbi:Peroxiredoxin-like 2A (Peroxiredoxin-like 2 activated in M-CSF stimulated monocytes) (Protein PAMM) (Redox-regulatory protein FAM213A), partial [Durusdinium trenchii]